MIDPNNDLDVWEVFWTSLFHVLDDRREQLGPIGEAGEIPTQTEAGLIAIAIESLPMLCEDEETCKAAFLHLVELTWEALARQKHEPPEGRERRKQAYLRWEGEQDAKLRALLDAASSGDGAGPAQQRDANPAGRR